MKALAAIAAGLVFLVGAQDEAAIKKDKELLKGLWKFESLETEQGKKDDFGDATLKFDGDHLHFTKGDERKKAEYTINPAGKPKEIDIKPEDKDQPMPGVYRIEKDTLTICIAFAPGAARPNEFAAKETNVVITLKKVKE